MKNYARFITTRHHKGSYNHILTKFLRNRRKKANSERTIERLYYSLHPIGIAANNPQLTAVSNQFLIQFTNTCWLTHAPETMRTRIADTRQFFRWCKKRGYTKRNIAKAIKPVRQNHRRNQRNKAVPEQNAIALMEHLANQLNGRLYRDIFRNLQTERQWSSSDVRTLRDLFILTFLYETGARAGELVTLGSRAMDTATKQPAHSYAITMNGKTNDRDRYFTNHTAELWHIWQHIRPSYKQEFAVIGWRNGRLDHNQLRPQALSNMLVRRCKKADIPHFRTHALRHAKVTRSRRAVGIDLAKILIDHSSLRSTEGYNHIDEDELTAAILATGLSTDII